MLKEVPLKSKINNNIKQFFYSIKKGIRKLLIQYSSISRGTWWPEQLQIVWQFEAGLRKMEYRKDMTMSCP